MNWIKENIEKVPSFNPFMDQILVIEESTYSNPGLCVETCKSLIEGICKTILTNKDIDYSGISQFQSLVHKTIGAIVNVEDGFRNDIIELGRRIASVAQKLGEIRNNAGFSSHGLDVLNPRLTYTISNFAYRITDNIGGFILNCYINNRAVNIDSRIHYRDCAAFNEYFDELNQIEFGIIKLSASEALYNQDYEAYRESYFDYLASLEEIADEITVDDELEVTIITDTSEQANDENEQLELKSV